MIKHSQIKRIRTAYNTLTESKEEKTYDFSCVMLDTLDDQLVRTVKSLKEGIDPEDLSGDENASDLHITALYGLHEKDGSTLEEFVKSHVNSPIIYKVKGLSVFENDEFDVLKFDVESEGLSKLNKQLKTLDYTTEYEDFHPHITVAFLKPGTGKKYAVGQDIDGQEFDSKDFHISLAESTEKVYFSV